MTSEYTLHADIPYAPPSALDQHKLNIYVPAKPIAVPTPVIVHIHGGGWQRGGRHATFYGAPYMASGYARHGFVSVAVSYRLGTAHPAHVTDVAAALRWVEANISRFGGEDKRVFLSGHSAGGHLAALLALDHRYATAAGLSPHYICGVVCLSGVFWLPNPLSLYDGCIKTSLYRRFYIQPTFGAEPDVLAAASPLHHVRSLPQMSADTGDSAAAAAAVTASVVAGTATLVSDPTAGADAAPQLSPVQSGISSLAINATAEGPSGASATPVEALGSPHRDSDDGAGAGSGSGTGVDDEVEADADLYAALAALPSDEKHLPAIATAAAAEPPTGLLARALRFLRSLGGPPPVPPSPPVYAPVPAPQYVPPFLVLNASRDLGLEIDGQRFYEELVARGMAAERMVVAGTTHATVTRSPVALQTAVRFVLGLLGRTPSLASDT